MEIEQSESAPEPVKTELPTPTFTEVSADKPVSTQEPKLLAKEVAEILLPEIEKRIQSTKDKRIAGLERRLETLGLAELEEMGVNIPEHVKVEARLRQMENALQNGPKASQGSGVGGDGNQEPKFDPSALLTEIGLDGNDPSVVQEWMKPHRNEDHLRAELMKIRNRQLSSSPPSPSAAPTTPGGGAGPVSADAKALYDRLAQLQMLPSKNRAAIEQTMKELREAGHPVD